MPTEKKADSIETLTERLAKAKVTITTEYRGMKMSDLTTLRRRLRDVNVELTVAKNTLTSIAADRAGKPSLKGSLKGPVALAFGYGDEADAAKALTEFVRSSRLPLTVTGGLLGSERIMSADDVNNLATLPPKNVLVAQVLGGIQAPVASFVGSLQALVGSFTWALQARIAQLQEGNN